MVTYPCWQARVRDPRWLAATLFLSGATGCLNPAFVNQVSGGRVVPLAPGDTPYIHVLFINATENIEFDVNFGWTPAYQRFQSAGLGNIAPKDQTGLVLGCPIDQIGLGSPTDLDLPALVLREGELSTNVPPTAFPLTLKAGQSYQCGDTVVFTVYDDRMNGYGINISTGRIAAATQTGPFSGPDTFQILQILQFSSGLPPTPVP